MSQFLLMTFQGNTYIAEFVLLFFVWWLYQTYLGSRKIGTSRQGQGWNKKPGRESPGCAFRDYNLLSWACRFGASNTCITNANFDQWKVTIKLVDTMANI
jgi:hypothetical protein